MKIPAKKPKQSHQSLIQEQTARRLMEALERMRAGKTTVLTGGFKWTKTNWAKEAGVHITTPLRRDAKGDFVFKEANLAFAQQLPTAKVSTVKKLRLRIQELEATVQRMHKQMVAWKMTHSEQ